MSYQYDYFISYAQEDNADGFVEQFVERLVNTLTSNPSGAEPRVSLTKKPLAALTIGRARFELKSTRRCS